MRSIQSRLALGLTLSLVILLFIQWLVVSISIRYLTESYIATHLIQDSETLLASVFLANDRDIKLDKSKSGLIYSQPFSGQYYKVTIGKTEFRSRSLWDTDLSHIKIATGNSSQATVPGPQQQTLLQVTSRYKKNSKLIVISVAEDLTPVDQDISTFQVRYSIVTLLISVILIAIQAIIVNRNLKPLDNIRRELKSLDKGLINALPENVPVEVLPLVEELNRQLKAFRQRLERSRNATGNLAHALKTPLSLLYQLADDPSLVKHKNLKQTVLQAAETIDRSIKRELKRARIAGKQFSARQSKIEPEIKSLIETLTTIYQHKNINVHYVIPKEMVCNIDRQDLLELLGNVLDNAFKWAQHKIELTIEDDSSHSGEIVFIIEDDGPGCSIDEIKQLTERGSRLDEQTTGHGLGLSIVQSIVDDYKGQLVISSSKNLGGLTIKIILPRHPA